MTPRRWDEYNLTHSTSSPWTRIELIDAFAELPKQSTLSKKFCFFIDGLDEYDGDHKEVIDLMRNLTTSTDIKICASSRPLNVFEMAFGRGSHPTIRLEDLTRIEINLYVRGTLEENHLSRQLKTRDNDRCEELVKEIVDKARGVFLWVFLIVRFLIKGLTNADRISDLQRRLHRLPVDLEPYFQHMLDTIDDNYQEQTAQTFQIALQASEPLTLMTYAMLDELEENPNFAFDLPIRTMYGIEIQSKYDDMRLRINARCKDLLEVTRIVEMVPLDDLALWAEADQHDCDGLVPDDAAYGTIGLGGVLSSNPFFDYQVEFLHRTVRDFCRVRGIHNWMASRTPKGFNLNELLCQGLFAHIKTVPLRAIHSYKNGPLLSLADDFFHFAHETETDLGYSQTFLLDELSRVITCRIRVLQSNISFYGPTAHPEKLDPSMRELRRSMLGYAVQRDLRLYVSAKLDEWVGGSSGHSDNYCLVLGALRPFIVSKYSVSPSPEMVRLLFRKGLSLIDLIQAMHEAYRENPLNLDDPSREVVIEALSDFLRYNVDFDET